MTDEKRSSIIDKIKKLQRLAERAGTPEEAASAAARIQEMLFKYNLELTTIDATPEPDAYGQDDITLSGGAFNRGWHRSLLHLVAENNFCTTVNRHASQTSVIIGQKHNTEMVRYLYGYLAREIASLAQAAMRTNCESDLPGPRGAWARSFCLGAVGVIGRRLREQRRTDMTASPSSTAMVLVTDAALKAALARAFPKLVNGHRGARAQSSDALRLGRAAGERIPLNRPVGSGAAPRAFAR